MPMIKKKTIAGGGGNKSFLWTVMATNFDILQISTNNKNLIEMVAKMAAKSPVEASAFFGITPIFAELLAKYWKDDQRYLSALKAGNSNIEERPMQRVYQRLAFSTALLFKIDDEDALLDKIKCKRNLPKNLPSAEEVHINAFYLNYIKRTLAQPLYFIHHFSRIVFGLQASTLSALHRYDDLVVNQAAFFKTRYKLRVNEDDLLTLLTTENDLELKRTKLHVLMQLLEEVNDYDNEKLSTSETVRNSISDVAAQEDLRREMLAPLTLIYDKATLNETLKNEEWLESYSQPYLSTYMILIQNGIPHSIASKFFSKRIPKSDAKMITLSKHMSKCGIQVRFTENWKILNIVDYTLATLFLEIYLSAVKGSHELKPLLTLTCYHFFRLQVCQDLPRDLTEHISDELSPAKAAKLVQNYADGTTTIKYEDCNHCHTSFWHIVGSKPLCPFCQTTR